LDASSVKPHTNSLATRGFFILALLSNLDLSTT
jgi:hypothetical protein